MTDAERLYVQEVKKLPPDDRLRLAHRILQDLILEGEAFVEAISPHLTDLYGLGQEVWSGVDPDQYVSELRDEWERGK